jgi:HSP20 family protein
MVMSRWDWDWDGEPFSRFRSAMGRLFSDFARAWPAMEEWTSGTAEAPAVNLWEDENNVYAEAELPGLKMEDLEVCVRGQELMLRGGRTEAEESTESYQRRERATGPFRRSLELPVHVDADKISATLDEGVLTITLPKSPEARSRKIEVKRSTGKK